MKFMKKILLLGVMLFMPLTVKALEDTDLLEVEYQKLFDIEKPSGYSGLQGMVITDKYFVVATIKNDGTDTALLRYDKKTFEMVGEPVVNGNLGHANDMAYKSDTNEIYVVEGTKLYVLDSDTLVQKNSIDMPNRYSSVDLDQNHYYLRDENNIYIYDKNFEEQSSFPIKSNYARQGISQKNGYIYYSLYVISADDVWKNGTSLVRVYDFNGQNIKTLYSISGYGELEAMEFDGEEPYLLFQLLTGNGGVYVPKYNTVNEKFSISDDTKEEKSSATLYSDSKRIETVDLINGKYTFSDISYDKPGEYTYRVEKESKERQKDTITITTKVSYDASTNTLSTETNYDAAGFQEVMSSVDNEVINTPTTPNNSANELEPGTVENPQTGSFIPSFIVPILLGIAVGVVICKRKLFFKL